MILVIGGAYQGKKAFAMQLASEMSYEVIDRFQDCVRKQMEEEIPLEPFLEALLKKNPHTIIVMDEVGYGIVPMKAQDREYREWVGAAGQFLAKEAEKVYRVMCGIGVQIK